jgi:hypothetical protein
MVTNELEVDTMLLMAKQIRQIEANSAEIAHGVVVRAKNENIGEFVWTAMGLPERLKVVALRVATAIRQLDEFTTDLATVGMQRLKFSN